MAFLKLSATKASTWLGCPRRYFFTYVLRTRVGQPWAHLSFGNSVHAALREWFELPASRRVGDSVPDLVARVWIDAGFRDPEQSREWQGRAVAMVAAYVADLEPDFQPMSTERSLAFKADSFIVEGRIDRIDEWEGGRQDRVSIVDYKTGRSVPTTGDVRGSQALAMYALMTQRALGLECFDVSLHHLPSGTVVTWEHTESTLERHLDRVAQIAQDVIRAQDTWESSDGGEWLLDELFPAQPSALCGFCDYWESCAPGQQFTARKRTWEGLDA